MVASVSKRYAKAAFELASQEGRSSEWLERLHILHDRVSVPEARAVLTSPVVPESRRLEAVDVVDEDGRIGPEVRNLAKLLIEARRIDDLGAVVDEFERLVDEAAGRVRATVTTAIGLGEDDRRRLSSDLSKQLGQEVRLESRVDPSILGGIVLQLGDRLVDASLRGRLQQLRRQLAGA
jgi:F-type H+-transporting ATPase subunit delta